LPLAFTGNGLSSRTELLPRNDSEGARGIGHSRVREIARLCCVVVLLLHSLGYVSALWAWVCCVISWVMLSELSFRPVYLTSLDYAVIGLWLFELASIPASSYSSNGWLYVEQLTIALSLYFSVSRLRSGAVLGSLILLVSVIATFYVASDINHFFDRYAEWKLLNFGTIGDVKRTLTVADLSPAGVHYTIYLCFAAWGLAGLGVARRGPRFVQWIGLALVAASVIGVVLSLSRGLYLGLLAGSCCASAFFLRSPLAVRRARKLAIPITAALILAVVGFSFRTDISHDLFSFSGKGSTSTHRSTQGRLFIWQRTLQLGETRPVIGFGAYTFPLYGAGSMTQEEGGPADNAFNLPIQLFFERGVIGVVLYAGFFIVVFRTAWVNMRNMEGRKKQLSLSCAAATGLTWLLVRDLSYTTLFDDKAVTVWAFGLIGLITLDRLSHSRSERKIMWLRAVAGRFTIGTVIILLFVVGSHRIRRAMSDFYLAQAVEAESMRDSKSASDLSSQAFSLLPTPYLQAQKGLFVARLGGIHLGEQGLPVSANSGFDDLSLETRAMSFYEKSVEAFPNEAAWQHNIAWFLWLRGDRISAVKKVRHAVDLEPNTALYRQALVLMLVAESELTPARTQVSELLMRSPEVVDSPWWQKLSVEQVQVAHAALYDAIAALDSNGDESPIHNARKARLYLEAGDFASAESLLQKTLLSLPGMPGAWRSYGLILARRHQWDAAAEALERAVFLDSWDCASYYALSQVTLQLGGEKDGERADMTRLSAMFHTKATRIQTAIRRSPESLRAYRKFKVEAAVPDDLAVEGLLQFCLPDMTREYARIVQ
jgi:tetratricopeptide (TPR) repeat protein